MADGRWQMQMADGTWQMQMADGRWQMADGKWQMADGKWQMADGKWQNDKWQMADGKWQMADDKSQGHICQGTLQLRPFLSTVGQQSPKQSTNERNQVMAKHQHFEELPVWQEAARLYNAVLDLLEEPGVPLTPGFRNQLDRSSLSVSNNVAEGFERSTTNELLSFIAIARGSAGEVRSMMAVVKDRPKLKRYIAALQQIRKLAESCARQLTGWEDAVDKLPFEGRRHLSQHERASRQAAQKARDYRLNFLKNLKASHPLYNSTEARAARGEIME